MTGQDEYFIGTFPNKGSRMTCRHFNPCDVPSPDSSKTRGKVSGEREKMIKLSVRYEV